MSKPTDLTEARALLAAITQGEWQAWGPRVVIDRPNALDLEGAISIADCDMDVRVDVDTEATANAAFIARAPALVAKLVAEVERLRALIVEPDARNSTPDPCRLDPHDMCPDDGCAKTGVCLLRYDDPRLEPRHD